VTAIDWVVCSRCQRDATPDEMRETVALGLPREWEGPPPVCPSCQLVAWHPHCTRAGCGHLDLGVSWIDPDPPPAEWHCAACGGDAFEGAHRP